MVILLFVLHVLIALALIGVVMLQKSEGGALGMGGGGMSGFMTGRSTANLLTRTTAILAAAFFATSILLVVLSNAGHGVLQMTLHGGNFDWKFLSDTDGTTNDSGSAPCHGAPARRLL